MPDKQNKAEVLFEEALGYFPGGVSAAGRYHGVLKRPLYLDHADGAYLIDVDGHKYLDFYNSAGAAFFGYNHPELKKAVLQAVNQGFFMNFDTEHHVRLAQMLHAVIPCAEKVRFVNTGTEATLAALRIARAYTGREKILKFEGHFHGMHECIFYNHGKCGQIAADGEIEAVPDTPGIPSKLRNTVIVVEFNDLGRVEAMFNKYKGEIAAVILEPISYNCGCMPARPEFLQGVRELCNQHKTVLIFDEVLSGFRMCLGGAQAWYGVVPDVATFAKALGGGFPIAAVVGRAEIMDVLAPSGKVIVSGTYSGSLMPVLVAIKCVEIMSSPGFYQELNEKAGRFYAGINELFERYQIPGFVKGIGARFAFFFGLRNEEDIYTFRSIVTNYNHLLYVAFTQSALEAGLYFHCGGWAIGGIAVPEHCGITAAHSWQDLEVALDKLEAVFQKLSSKVKDIRP
ncbi:MAG: aspartate aminotransferase family protein [Candidatus Hadarchaeum sp.]|uniref:aspartate aminotransferase family protein n=1 Tax=Candidatus Hadarchaeum sp. TaxID=2883567 RepID=UPI003179AC18